jgi:FdhD protein
MVQNRPALRLGLGHPGDEPVVRALALEVPVAIEVCGLSYAVMMATPSDLDDYALGFALSEGLIESIEEVLDLTVHELESGGWVVRLNLPPAGAEKAMARARVRVTESSCGLCGMDNIAQVLRPLPKVEQAFAMRREAISAALEALPALQPLSQETGGAHAAAFCAPDGTILLVREDVGRHNALDKLLGGLARAGRSAREGFILLTARCSYELVEKTVRAGCPVLVTISAPTSLAAERAAAAGLTLVALARPDAALLINDPARMLAATKS